MPSLSLIDSADPETDDSPSRLTRWSNRLFGDPRKAPRRLATLFVFALFGVITFGVWLVANAQVDTAGSSAPIVGPLMTVLTSVWTVPVLALWLTRRWVFFKRGRYADKAAEITGWTTKTIKHLRDEIRTTDGCTRVISSTDDSQADIAKRIDASLDGDYDDDTVDFWDQPSSAESLSDPEEIIDSASTDADNDDDTETETDDQSRREELIDRENDLISEHNRKTDRIDELLNEAIEADIDPSPETLLGSDDRMSPYELMDDESQEAVDEAEQLIEECEQIQQNLDAVQDELNELEDTADAVFEDVVGGIATAYALDDALFEQGYNRGELRSDAEETDDRSRWHRIKSAPGRALSAIAGLVSRDGTDEDTNDETMDSDETEIPWRVRFFEEIKHLWLDLQSGFRTGDFLIKFGVPASVAFVLQLFVAGLWTHPVLYLVFIATSTLVGLCSFWIVKRRRQRRLKRYRTNSSSEYWLDCAGQFKTVTTADVTAYMGFIAGRRYASYNRAEFVRKTSRTMYEHVSDECVSPSDLEHNARCLEQMKPNLQGYQENITEVEIMRELKQTVEGSEDDIIAKAELAWSVIEQPTTSRIEKRLGHDPDLVAAEYRFLVEDAHVLDEREVRFTDASGEDQSITIVFPADKDRLPDMSERHSQFSDRFSDRKGDPVYELPEVDPRDDLSGFIPTPEAAALFDGETPGAVSGGS